MQTEPLKLHLQTQKLPVLVVLVGPPLSGKDTLLRLLDLANFTILSRDEILLALAKHREYRKAYQEMDPEKVDALFNQKLWQAYYNKENVIINKTNLRTKGRRFLTSAFKGYHKVAVVFNLLSIEEYFARNQKRKLAEHKEIPEEVIQGMISSYEPVTKDEGFDEVFYIQND